MEDQHYSLNSEFLIPEELAVGQEFLRDGYKIFPVEDKKVLVSMRNHLVKFAAQFLGEKDPHNHDEFLNLIHDLVDNDKINDLRLFVFEKFNRVSKFHNNYIVVESWRNEQERVNMLFWQLTCEAFFSVESWEWLFSECKYKGFWDFIFFE